MEGKERRTANMCEERSNILTAKKPQLPQPAMKRAAMNMPTFCAPQSKAPPIMEKNAQ